MTQLPVQIEKIAGLADETWACGIFTKRITFEGGAVGTVVSTIIVKSDGGEDNQTYLRDIFEITTQKLEDAKEGPLDILKEAGEAGKEYAGQRKLEASFVNALIFKNALYLDRYGGEIAVWVFAGDESTELKFNYGSGLLKPGQIFLVGTQKFFSTFDTSTLKGGQAVDLEELMDGLATEISANSNQSEIGVAIIQVKGEDKQEDLVQAEAGDANGDEGPDYLRKGGDVEPTVNSLDETPVEEAVLPEVEVGEQVSVASPAKSAKGGLLKIAGSIFRLVWRELKQLKKGDLKAILRLRRNIAFVAVLVILVLAASAFLTIRSQHNKEKLVQFNEHMKNASSKLAEGEAVQDLNQARARDAYVAADKEVKSALSLEPQNQDAKSLSGQISQKLKETESSSSVSFQTYVDLGEQGISFNSTKDGLVAFSKDKMYAVDGSGKVGQSADTPSSILGYFYNNNGFVAGQDGKVDMVDFNGKKEEVAQEQTIRDISVFLGNIYILGSRQIAKYVPVVGGYTKSVDYLNDPQQFSPNSHLAIDGSVWVTNGNTIYKYTRGAKEDFSVSGLAVSNVNYGEIFTNADSDNLYVVDLTNSALLVFDKNGVYQKAYQSPEFANASGLSVDEVNNTMYILEGSKILSAKLQ